MRDEILDQLSAALPLDGVLLGLHGAMVAHGYDDVEGDVIERVRAIVGPKCVIGVELDPHCHLTLKRVLPCRHRHPLQRIPPHRRRGTRRGPADPRPAHRPRARSTRDVAVRLPPNRLLSHYAPADARLCRRTSAMEGKDGVLSVSIGHCFPYADVPELTGRILVITDNDKDKANASPPRSARNSSPCAAAPRRTTWTSTTA